MIYLLIKIINLLVEYYLNKSTVAHLFLISAFVINLSSLSTTRCIDQVALTEDSALRAEMALPALIPLLYILYFIITAYFNTKLYNN